MSTEQTKTLARRYYEAGNVTKLEVWDEICDPNFELLAIGLPEPIRGLAAVKQFTVMMHSAFSDFSLAIDDLFGEGDRATVRFTMRGTHTAPFMTPAGPLPPTGRSIHVEGIGVVRAEGGKLIEERVALDIMGMLQQLGVATMPVAPPN